MVHFASVRHHGCYTQAAWTNTPGTAGGPGGRDRTLAIKSIKTAEKKTKVGEMAKRARKHAWRTQATWANLLFVVFWVFKLTTS